MACLKNIDTRKREDFPTAIWLENPEDYPYVRESEFGCCSPRYIPKRKSCLLVTEKIDMKVPCKLIGYTKPEHLGNRLYRGKFWWLKGYDLTMPYAKYVYGEQGRWKDGKEYGIAIVPTEAVKFLNSSQQ